MSDTPSENVETVGAPDAHEAKEIRETVVPADPKKHAFSTLVMLGDKFVAGALVLGWSIKKAGSTASLVVLVTRDVSHDARAALAEVYDQVVEVPLLDVVVPPRAKGKSDEKRWTARVFTKLAVLNLTQFEKVCHLDADMVCSNNPDNIFSVSAPAGIAMHKLVAEDASAVHGQPVGKAIEQARAKGGMRGCVYLLKPSVDAFNKAIEMITVKHKEVTLSSLKDTGNPLERAKSSVYAVLNQTEEDDQEDGKDEAPEEEQVTKDDGNQPDKVKEEEKLGTQQQGEKEDNNKKDIVKKKGQYQYGEKKQCALMGADELLFLNLFKSEWHYLHPRFGHTSWKKDEVGNNLSIFVHFPPPDHPWARVKDWPDYVSWDTPALDLMKNKQVARDYLVKHAPLLVAKEKGEPLKLETPHAHPHPHPAQHHSHQQHKKPQAKKPGQHQGQQQNKKTQPEKKDNKDAAPASATGKREPMKPIVDVKIVPTGSKGWGKPAAGGQTPENTSAPKSGTANAVTASGAPKQEAKAQDKQSAKPNQPTTSTSAPSSGSGPATSVSSTPSTAPVVNAWGSRGWGKPTGSTSASSGSSDKESPAASSTDDAKFPRLGGKKQDKKKESTTTPAQQ